VYLSEKTDAIKSMQDRLAFLLKSKDEFIHRREECKNKIDALRNTMSDYDSQILEIKGEIASIERNWNIIIRSRDPVLKSKLIFRRFQQPCRVCGERMVSKKQLKVHLFEKHGY
jgi:hypothetical protein